MKHILVVLTLACSLGAPVFADPAATQMINDLRKDKRRKALSYFVALEKVAAAHANEMAAKGYFGHTVEMDRRLGIAHLHRATNGVLLLKISRKDSAALTLQWPLGRPQRGITRI